MKKLIILVLSIFLSLLCCLTINNINAKNLTATSNVNADFKQDSKDFVDRQDNEEVNVYVKDKTNDFNFNTDDNNFYFVASNKELSDEEVIDKVEKINKLQENFNDYFNKLNKIFNELTNLENLF